MRAAVAPVVSLDAVTAAATRAVQWAARNWAPRGPDAQPLALEALALVQLAHAVGAGVCRAGAALEAEIARAFPNLRWTESDLWVGMLAATGARDRVPALAPSAIDYLATLRELADEECLEGPAAALASLAFHGEPPAPPAPVTKLTLTLPPCPRDQLLSSLAAIEAATTYGCTRVTTEPHAPILLEGAAMAALRSYDLPLATRILRARRYLDDGASAGLDAGLEFLRLLQCDDGSFGDFDAALHGIAASGEQDGELRLKLPVTLQALWSMAELEDPDFRLVRHAFAPPAQPALGEACDAVQRAD